MFIARLKLGISGFLEVWYTDRTAPYYELQEKYLKDIIVNIIWLKLAITYGPLLC